MSKIVLHVDDSATMQMVADITFRGTEYQCVGARSVDEALEKAKATRPTLVLADAQMPGKTGYDLCMAIKSDPKLADVPVIILCGNAQAFDVARGGQVGADGTLPKPWDSQVMLEKVGEAVEKASKGVAKPGGAAAPSFAGPAATPPAAPTPVAAVAAAAANTKGVPQPPRSATIMGMPTIKMPPAGNAAAVPVTSATPPAAVAPAAAASPLSRPPASPAATQLPLRAPAAPATAVSAAAPAASAFSSSPASSFSAPAASPFTAAASSAAAAPAAASVAASPAAASVSAAASAAAAAPARPPMVSGTPTKRSALVERTLAKMAARLAEASGLEPGSPELLALLKLSTEVVERIVWEIVPELAEQIIRENLDQLTASRRN